MRCPFFFGAGRANTQRVCVIVESRAFARRAEIITALGLRGVVAEDTRARAQK